MVMLDSNKKADVCIVLVTCGSRVEAERIAERLVLEKLAACVNVLGDAGAMTSFYMWDGALQKEPEVLLIIKTTVEKQDALAQRMQQLHSYTVPELLVLPVADGSASYLEWVRQSLG